MFLEYIKVKPVLGKVLIPESQCFLLSCSQGTRVTVREAWGPPAPLWAGLRLDRPCSDLWAPSSERRHSIGDKGPEQQGCPSEGSPKSPCDSTSSAFPNLQMEDVVTVFTIPRHCKTLWSFTVTSRLTETNKQKNWTHGRRI